MRPAHAKQDPKIFTMIRARTDDADLDAVFGNPPRKTVEDVQAVASIQVIDGTLAVHHEGIFRHLHVDRSPPDVVRGGWLVHDALVLQRWLSSPLKPILHALPWSETNLGTASFFRPRVGNESARRGQGCSLFVSEGFFVQHGYTGCTRVVYEIQYIASPYDDKMRSLPPQSRSLRRYSFLCKAVVAQVVSKQVPSPCQFKVPRTVSCLWVVTV